METTSLIKAEIERRKDFFFDEVLKVYDNNNKYPPRSEEELTMLETVARRFYELGQRTKYQQDREEFAKLKAKEWQDGYDEGYEKGINARKED